MKSGLKLHQTLNVFLLAVGLVTIILGVNETTVDAFDRIGSNYWLAWCACISGAATFLLTLRRHHA
jgi:hypothetical protein